MKRIEVDIWVNQFIGFFDKNPGELTQLIGAIDKEVFFDKVRQRCIKNLEEGDEVSLTQKQLIDIIVSLNKANMVMVDVEKMDYLFQKTKFGDICLN